MGKPADPTVMRNRRQTHGQVAAFWQRIDRATRDQKS